VDDVESPRNSRLRENSWKCSFKRKWRCNSLSSVLLIVTLECVLILLFFVLWFQYGNYEEVIQQFANLTESSKYKTTTDDILFASVIWLIEENSQYFENKRDHSPVSKFRESEVLNHEFDFSPNEEGIQSKLEVIKIVRKMLDYRNKII